VSYLSEGYIVHDGFLRRWKQAKQAYKIFQKGIYSNPLKRKFGKYEFKAIDYHNLGILLNLIQWDLEYDIRVCVQEISKHDFPNSVGKKTKKFVKTKFVGSAPTRKGGAKWEL
jgi:hypothetical protein